MPSLGADMDEGTLVEWRVAVGDRVSRGDVVAVVDTDKATLDVEVFETGLVEELLVEEGVRVPVGTPLARIATGAAAAPPTPVAEPEVPAPEAEPPPVPPPVPVAEPPLPAEVRAGSGAGRHHASVVLSPLVRHLAVDLGVDAVRVRGSGPGGRVTRADVERAGRRRHHASPRARRLAAAAGVDPAALRGSGPAAAVLAADVLAAGVAAPTPSAGPPGATAAEGAGERPDRRQAARAAIARTMERAWREIPHFRLTSLVDMDPLLGWLAALNASRPPAERILPAAALLRATALAAAKVPDLNGWWVEGGFRPAERVDVGTVVSLRAGGLVTPTVTAADAKGLEQVMDELRDLVERARRGGLRSSDMAEASITLTNLGDQGAEEVHGIIHPPQVALVGVGRVTTRPWPEGDRVGVHRCVVATLAVDHRAADGRPGSRFLHALEAALNDPDRLLGGAP